jgi:hypothetical protein
MIRATDKDRKKPQKGELAKDGDERVSMSVSKEELRKEYDRALDVVRSASWNKVGVGVYNS